MGVSTCVHVFFSLVVECAFLDGSLLHPLSLLNCGCGDAEYK